MTENWVAGRKKISRTNAVQLQASVYTHRSRARALRPPKKYVTDTKPSHGRSPAPESNLEHRCRCAIAIESRSQAFEAFEAFGTCFMVQFLCGLSPRIAITVACAPPALFPPTPHFLQQHQQQHHDASCTFGPRERYDGERFEGRISYVCTK